jgi:L-asparagine transporter-like permease
MEFENLQAIWDTQNDKPVFAMQDARLLVALYQQREHTRRRLFREQFAPMYVAAPIALAFLGVVFVTFLFKGRFRHHGFPMSAWDHAGFAVVAGALLAIVVPMYLERKEHERTQEIFAPSLREELDRGIAQLDFEMGLQSTSRVMRILTLLSIVVVISNWEAGRLTGDPTPWWLALLALFCVFSGGWVGFAAKQQVMERARARKRALESMRAALDEDPVILPRK